MNNQYIDDAVRLLKEAGWIVLTWHRIQAMGFV